MTLPCGTVYALEIPQVGDNYGYAAPIYGVENGQQKQWIVDKYGLSAELQAALDSLYGEFRLLHPSQSAVQSRVRC